MPKCHKCNSGQSKLNKGGLCKAWFHKNCNLVNTEQAITPTAHMLKIRLMRQIHWIIQDREIIDLIKDNMLKERTWYIDMQAVLKEQIEFLKQECITKNTLI